MSKQKKIFAVRNIPNILTIARIVLILPIIVLISLSSSLNHLYTLTIDNLKSGPDLCLLIAGILFIIASFSDFLDGYLARKLNIISEFGKLWDPIADKVLTNAAIICFIYKDYVPFWFLIISMVRDICVEGFRVYAIKKNVDISAQKIGKWKTTFQMLGFVVVFFALNLPMSQVITTNENLVFWLGQNGTTIISLILSVISGIMYFINFYWKNRKVL